MTLLFYEKELQKLEAGGGLDIYPYHDVGDHNTLGK